MAARELEDLLGVARAVAEDVLAPQAEKVDREATWPETGIRALQESGLGGLVIPQRFGGHGHGLLAMARLCEELGRACSSTAISFGMHCVGSALIAAKATDEQHERYLTPIVEGRHLTTLALSEPGTGAHFYVSQTELTEQGAWLIVRGTKTFVTNGSHADSYVISTRAPGEEAGTFSCVVIDASAPDVSWGDAWSGFGMRGNDSRTMVLDGTRVPRANLLGQHGDQIWYVLNVVAPYFITAMAGTYLGIASGALASAVEHLTQRRHAHTGATLAENPVLQHRVGDLWSRVERTRQLVYAAAREGDAGAPGAPPTLFAAKAEVADTAVDVANEVLTLLGGIGYREGSSAQRFLRDARAAHVMAPTTDVLRTWIGRWTLGVPLFGG